MSTVQNAIRIIIGFKYKKSDIQYYHHETDSASIT